MLVVEFLRPRYTRSVVLCFFFVVYRNCLNLHRISVDLSTCTQTLIGHSDIIWDMDCSTADSSLASASSDGTIKIWQVDVKKNGLYQLKSTLKLSKTEPEVPTTVKWCPWAASQVFVGYSNGTVRLWDAETEKVVSVFETKVEGELNGPVNGLALQGDLKVLLATIGKWIRGWNLSGTFL